MAGLREAMALLEADGGCYGFTVMLPSPLEPRLLIGLHVGTVRPEDLAAPGRLAGRRLDVRSGGQRRLYVVRSFDPVTGVIGVEWPD